MIQKPAGADQHPDRSALPELAHLRIRLQYSPLQVTAFGWWELRLAPASLFSVARGQPTENTTSRLKTCIHAGCDRRDTRETVREQREKSMGINARNRFSAGVALRRAKPEAPIRALRAKKTQPIRVGFLGIGGAGGNRTPVRKPSTDSSTYLAWLFSLILHAPTDKRLQDELP